MKKLFENANEYCRRCDWKDLSMLKLCLLALGLIIGVSLPVSCRTAVYVICGIVFVVTFIPLMAKFFKVWFGK